MADAKAKQDITPAHFQTVTLHIEEWYPDHTPRKEDRHYRHFNFIQRKLKAEGKLICDICDKVHDAPDPDNPGHKVVIQIHHKLVEYAESLGVDIALFEKAHPEYAAAIGGTEEGFLKWCETMSNFRLLCTPHHIGPLGIHKIPGPNFELQKYWTPGLPAPAQIVKA